MTTPVVRLVLRDLILTALGKQGIPVTAQQLTVALAPYWDGDMVQVRRVLRELEAGGMAVRRKESGARPGGGRAPALWRASSGERPSCLDQAPQPPLSGELVDP